MANSLDWETLVARIAACRVCEGKIPEPRPVFRLSRTARILVIGQAPGRRVHETGIPWNDPSGDRLRDWMDLDRDQFYDVSRIAILPMGLCFPGTAKGSDLPPRPECAPLWHPPVLEHLKNLELILLVGVYAHRFYGHPAATVADTVRRGEADRRLIPLVHPSPRNRGWLKNNPWFDEEIVPALKQRVASTLSDG